ncbi:hypothetical protein ACFL26_00310 [Patescibacteria group bacterium]
MRYLPALFLSVALVGCGAAQSRGTTPEPTFTPAGPIELLLEPGWSVTKVETKTFGKGRATNTVDLALIENGRGSKLAVSRTRDNADLSRFTLTMTHMGMSIMNNLLQAIREDGPDALPPGTPADEMSAELAKALREVDSVAVSAITMPEELLFEKTFTFTTFYLDGRVEQTQIWTMFDDDENPRELFVVAGTWPQAEAEARRAEVMTMARSVRLRPEEPETEATEPETAE